MTLLDGCSMY